MKWSDCPRCERPLQSRTARRTDEGWCCANRRSCSAILNSNILGGEIAFLRSWGWDAAGIAQRLGVTAECVQKRLARPALRVSA